MPRAFTVRVPGDDGFAGIDRRRKGARAPKDSLYFAENVDLTPGRTIKARDGFREYRRLPPGRTIGLYAINGQLRVAAPAGYGMHTASIPNVFIDIFGDVDGAPTPLDAYVRVSSATTWDVDPTRGPLPYLVLETPSGTWKHHWLRTTPPSLYDGINTRIQTGFNSGPDIIKAEEKLWAVDATAGVRFSSTLNGPSDWTSPGDAGFLPVFKHMFSGSRIRGLTLHQKSLFVVFDDSIQQWAIDPDPANHSLTRSLNGPGTQQFGSLQPVIGDVFYLSEGGFRSLATTATTGEQREFDGIGAPIIELTRELANVPAERIRSVWSQARSQYICVVNDADGSAATAYVFTWLPMSGVMGWTTWRLPVALDYLIENETELFARRGDVIYRFDPEVSHDDINGVELRTDAFIETQFIDSKAAALMKSWSTLDIDQDGACDVHLLVDQSDRSDALPVASAVVGPTFDGGSIPIDTMGHTIALRLTGIGAWELTSMEISGHLMGGAG
jgi:hypothetical protein